MERVPDGPRQQRRDRRPPRIPSVHAGTARALALATRRLRVLERQQMGHRTGQVRRGGRMVRCADRLCARAQRLRHRRPLRRHILEAPARRLLPDLVVHRLLRQRQLHRPVDV